MFKSNSFFVCGVVTQDQGQGVDKLVCLPFFLNPDADTLRRLRTVGYILVMYSSCIEVRWWISWSIHGLLSLLHFIVFVQTIGYYCQQQGLDAVYIFFFPSFLVIQPPKIIELWGHSGICYLLLLCLFTEKCNYCILDRVYNFPGKFISRKTGIPEKHQSYNSPLNNFGRNFHNSN